MRSLSLHQCPAMARTVADHSSQRPVMLSVKPRTLKMASCAAFVTLGYHSQIRLCRNPRSTPASLSISDIPHSIVCSCADVRDVGLRRVAIVQGFVARRGRRIFGRNCQRWLVQPNPNETTTPPSSTPLHPAFLQPHMLVALHADEAAQRQ